MKIKLKKLKLDLSDLEELGSSKELNFKVEFPHLFFQDRKIAVPKPLQLSIKILNTDKSYFLTGNLKGILVLKCSRCLEKFEYNLNIDIEEELNKLDIKDIKEVDIRQILKSNIFLDLPIKPLCSEDCKGLCPQCGQNLNNGDCNCERDIIDPRLAKLEKFFDEK